MFVNVAGAEAVTAVKLAVELLIIEAAVLWYCFLKYPWSVVKLEPYCFAAYSVTRAVLLWSVNEVSFEISSTVYPFKLN